MMRFFAVVFVMGSPFIGAAVDIEVAIAPDQPIPHVYIDDVLVLELRSSHDTEARVVVTITDSSETEESALDDTLALRARGIRWVPLEAVAQRRGRYVARVAIEAGGETLLSTHAFCRIDRPASMLAPPVGATVSAPNPYTLLAMRDLPLDRVCFAGDHPELDDIIPAAVHIGLKTGILLDLTVTTPEAARALLDRFADSASYWAIQPGANPDALDAVASVFASRSPQLPFALVADTPEELGGMLRASSGWQASAIAYRHDAPLPDAIKAFEQAAQAAGYEHLPLHVIGRGVSENGPDRAARLIQNLLTLVSCGVAQAAIDGGLLFQEDDVSEAYVFLSALARRVAGAAPIGVLDTPAPLRAYVFRREAAWLITAWSEEDPGDLVIPTGDAVVHEFADASNNPLPLPSVTDGTVSLTLTREPVYLTGEGGTVMAATARRMMQSAAERFASNDAHAALLPEQVAEIFTMMRSAESARIERSQFLALLPMFPLLESQWHTGVVPGEVAVPAMRALSDIIRYAAVIEQGSGEPFVQPLQDTLATCAEFQQEFLMRAETPPDTRQRADWLLAEVTRLVEDAKQLDRADRTIEANAVAMLARWRAQSLNATLNYVPPPSEASDNAEGGDEGAEPENAASGE